MALDPDTNLLSPIGHAQLKDELNKIPVGGKITVYNTGTTVLSKIYKTPDGLSAWANPILIDSLGHANLEIWLPVGKSYDFILTDDDGSIIQIFEGISGINDPTRGGGVDASKAGEWVLAGSVVDQAPGYVDIDGDWSTKITPFKRLKLVILNDRHGWATNITLLTSVPPVTRIEYELDDDAIIVGRVNALYYGLISHVNTSYPNVLGGAVYIKRGKDFTADAHMEIWDTSGNFHYVQGTATVSSFGITKKTQPGSVKWLLFRNDAIIIPTGNSIRTISNKDMNVLAGDIVQVILDDVTGLTYAFGALENTADLSQTQSIEKKQMVLSGELDSSEKPYLLKTPKLVRAHPTMTANNAPAGYLATISSIYDATGNYEPWHAFDGTITGYGATTLVNKFNGEWFNLSMPTAKKVRAYSVGIRSDANVAQPSSWYLQGSNNGIDYENIDYRFDITSWALGETKLFYLTYIPKSYTNFRFYCLSVVGTQPVFLQVAELTLYEFSNDSDFLTTTEVPFSPVFGTETNTFTAVESFPLTMSSDVLPVPYVATSSNNYVPKMPYHAFDSDNATGWQATQDFVSGEWLKLDLGTPKSITSYTIDSTNAFATKASSPADFVIYGSNDNTVWEEVDNRIDVGWIPESAEIKTFQLNNPSKKYRYYRLDIIDVSEESAQAIPDTKYPPPLTANNDQGYKVSASSRVIGGIEHNAFDGDKTTASNWVSLTNTFPQWLKIEFPTAITLGKYVLTGSFTVSSPVDWTLEGSNDDTAWTVLDTQTSVIWTADSEDKTFTLAIPQGPYLFFRINITKSNILSQAVGIIELELWVNAFVQVFKFGALINNLRFNSLSESSAIVDSAYPENQVSDTASISANRYYVFPQVPIMTSNTAPAPYVISSNSEHTSLSYQAFKVYNKQNVYTATDFYHSIGNSVFPIWHKTKLQVASLITNYTIQMPSTAASVWWPLDWTFEGSNNDSAWTILDTQTNISWVNAELKSFAVPLDKVGSYLYYRFNITRTAGGTSLVIGEIVFDSTGNFSPWRAFDSSASTGWYPGTTFISGDWLKIDVIPASFISKYKIKSQQISSLPCGCPKTFTLQGSTDDVNWSVIDTQTNITWTGALEEKTFILPANSNTYRFFKLIITATSNGSPPYIIDFRLIKTGYIDEVSKILPVSTYGVYDNNSLTYSGTDPLVPPMTSTTTPAGYTVSSSGDYNAASASFRAFDGDTNYPNSWYSNTGPGCWVQVKLPTARRLKCFLIVPYIAADNDNNYKPSSFSILGSNDGTNFTTIQSFNNDWVTLAGPRVFALNQLSVPYLYFRLTVTAISAQPYVIINEWILYDFDVWSVVPNMTSNTAPAGYVASSISISAANTQAFEAFKNTYYGYFYTAQHSQPWWLQIQLPYPVTLLFYTLHNYHADGNYAPTNWTLQGSNDGVAWTVIQTYSQPSWPAYAHRIYAVPKTIPYSYFRLNVTALSGSSGLLLKMWRLFAYNPTTYKKITYPEIAFDNKSTSYHSDKAEFVKLKIPTPTMISKYSITPSNGDNLISWSLYSSNDDITWTVLDTRTDVNPSIWKIGIPVEFQVVDSKGVWRYFMISVTKTSGTQLYYSIVPAMTSDTTPSGYIASASDVYQTSYAFGAFSRNGNVWHSNFNGVYPNWVQIKLPSSASLIAYSIHSGSARYNFDWTVQGSNNGSSWVILDTRTSQFANTSTTPIYYLGYTTASYLYFRLNITRVQGGESGDYPVVEEWTLYSPVFFQNGPTISLSKLDIAEIKMYSKEPYNLYYESNVSSLHSFASGFDDKGWRNIPKEMTSGKTYLGVNPYMNNTFVSSRLEKDGSIAVHEDYRFPWLIADDSYFGVDSSRQFPDWPIFWNGANFTFTPTNQSAIMTSNILPTGYVASAGFEQAGNEAFMAFDSLPDTYWRAGFAQIFSWIKLKIPTGIAIRGVIVQAPNLQGVGTPNSWTIEGSNDNISWTALDSVIGQTNWALGERRTFLFPENNIAYTYYRMNITNASLGTLNYFGISQLDFYSFPQTTAPSVIEDQYFNKGTITGIVGVTSVPSYNDKSVLDFNAGSGLTFTRVAGFEISSFTFEVKMRLKSDITGFIFPLNSNPTYSLLVGYNYNNSPKDWGLWLSSNGTSWNIADGSLNKVVYPMTVGEWYHLRLSFDGSVYIFSVNDVELIKVYSQTKVVTPTALSIMARTPSEAAMGYVYDIRYLPFYEPPDRVFDIPFYPILRYDPVTNLSGRLLDINYQFRTGPSRWQTNTEFLLGEYNTNIYGAVTPITYAYGGITYLPITILQQATGDPPFFQVNHIFGTHQFTNYLNVVQISPIPVVNKGTLMPIDGLGFVSGTATWSGIRVPFLRYRNTIGIKWPQNDSTDYLAIYTGNQAVGIVSGAELTITGIFRRNF